MSTYNKAYYACNRERIGRTNKAWRDRNPDKVLANVKKWQAANGAKKSASAVATRRKAHGFTREYFEARMSQQGGQCAICSVALTTGLTARAASADHCHLTNTPRGILCKRCNLMLGHAKDDPALLLRAIEYLTMWKRTA